MTEDKPLNPTPSTVYDSSRLPPPLVEEIRAVAMYRELIVQFVSRSIKTRYKRSALGVFWTMLNPLLTMVILTVVFSQLFKFSVENYAVYVLCGLVVWSFFSSATTSAMGEMLWSGDLLGRIYVPKSIFSISAVGTSLVNLLISLVPLLLIALVLGLPFRPSLVVLPLSILILVIFALGVGLLLSTAAVYFADMVPVYEVLLVMWMYLTPIIYPVEIVPENLVWLLKINPMYYILEVFRAPIYAGVIPGAEIWWIASGFAAAVFILGGFVFTAKSHEYAYRI